MLKKSREEKILKLLKLNGSVEVKEVMNQCDVSENTARRDLKRMHEQGLLNRIHGGAIQSEPNINLVSFNKKLSFNAENKEKLGKVAAGFVADNDVIFVDCGTTLYYIHKHLHDKNNLIVITNSLPVGYQLSDMPEIKTIIVGGEIDPERKAVYGPIAEKNVKEYFATKAFIGSDGVSLRNGLSSFEIKESAITKNMINNSKEVFLVVNSPKVEKEAFIKFASLKEIDHIITDGDLSDEIQKKYKEKIDFIIA